MSEKGLFQFQKAREMKEPDTTEIVEPSELMSRRDFTKLVGGALGAYMSSSLLGGIIFSRDDRPDINTQTGRTLPTEKKHQETIGERLDALNPDYEKMNEFARTFEQMYGSTTAKGLCLQGTADVLEKIYPELAANPTEMGVLRNGQGITAASIALEKLRCLPQFKELILKPEEQQPDVMREVLKQLPNGVIVSMTGAEGMSADVYTDIEGEVRHAGHISFLYKQQSTKGRESTINLGSDGVLDLEWYLKNMPTSEFVLFVPTKDYKPQEYEWSKHVLPDIKGLTEDMHYGEYIRTHAKEFMKLSPGGYALGLEETDLAAIDAETAISSQRNAAGTDERSITEMAFFARLAQTIDVHARNTFLRKYDSSLVDKIDSYIGSDNWQPIGPEEVTPGDIMLALQGAGSRKGRELGMDLLWEMQKNGSCIKYGINPLTDNEIIWAHENGIHPVILAWATVMKPWAVQILSKGQDIFFDQPPFSTNPEDYISSPGLIAGLAREETSSGTFIGDAPVQTQWNLDPRYFPTSEHDMKQIAIKLEKNIGLPYTQLFTNKWGTTREYWQYIPGSRSYRTYDGQPGSGGAIMGQFMPIYLNEFMNRYEQVQQKIELPDLQPSSPWGMTLLWYLYLNSRFYQLQGQADKATVLPAQNVKGGYQRGNEDRIYNSLAGWNPDSDEINRIFETGLSYSEKITPKYNR